MEKLFERSVDIIVSEKEQVVDVVIVTLGNDVVLHYLVIIIILFN